MTLFVNQSQLKRELNDHETIYCPGYLLTPSLHPIVNNPVVIHCNR